MSSQRRQGAALLVVAGLLFVAVPGCVPPAPEAVLEGTWELTGDLLDSDVSQFLITFDQDGQISAIRYVYDNFTIVINADELVDSFANVDGQEVFISASWGSGSTLTFNGTLNAAETEIVGTTSYRLVIAPLIIVEVPTGPAVLTRQ
jgi:hypothetical protein